MTTAAIVVTIIVVLLTVVVLALYLLKIAVTLSRALSALRTLNQTLTAIPPKAEPAGPVLQALNSDLGNARGVLENLVARKAQAAPASQGGPALKPPGPGTAG